MALGTTHNALASPTYGPALSPSVNSMLITDLLLSGYHFSLNRVPVFLPGIRVFFSSLGPHCQAVSGSTQVGPGKVLAVYLLAKVSPRFSPAEAYLGPAFRYLLCLVLIWEVSLSFSPTPHPFHRKGAKRTWNYKG